MIAYHIFTGKIISIQLKGSRVTLNKKYKDKNIWIAYIDQRTDELCMYDHDLAVDIFEKGQSALTESCLVKGQYSGMSLHNQFNDIIIRL
jgi:hypothetical protein